MSILICALSGITVCTFFFHPLFLFRDSVYFYRKSLCVIPPCHEVVRIRLNNILFFPVYVLYFGVTCSNNVHWHGLRWQLVCVGANEKKKSKSSRGFFRPPYDTCYNPVNFCYWIKVSQYNKLMKWMCHRQTTFILIMISGEPLQR